MSITINTNLSSLVVQLSMKGATIDLNRAIERMTTGYKINSAKDDAAGYSISTNMTTKLGAYRVAETNATTGLDMVSTAVNTLDLMSNQLSRLRSLAVQAQNGTYGSDSVSALNVEADTITNSLNRLMNSAEYNGKKLFNAIDPPEGFNPIDVPKAGASGFIDETFTKIDTSTMKTLTSAVTDGETIKGGTWAIGSVEDLVKLAELTNTTTDNTTGTTFVLSEDIDLSGIDNWTPIGDRSTNNSYKFKGTFDGNGHVIKNLKINNPSKDSQGLFGCTENATIQNVGLENVNVTGQNNVGGLVGDADDLTLTNSYATGNVTGRYPVGGLVGLNLNGSLILDNSYAAGNVTGQYDVGGLVGEASSLTLTNSYATGNVTGERFVGCLVGGASDLTLTNSYATGDVTGERNVGGLVGTAGSLTLTNSYATGDVTGQDAVGGLVGDASRSTLTNSYATGNVSGQDWVGGLVGRVSQSSGSYDITGCTSYSTVTGTNYAGSFIGGVVNTTNDTTYGTVNITDCKALPQGLPLISGCYTVSSYLNPVYTPNSVGYDAMCAGIGEAKTAAINLQIGIDSSANSQITVDTSIKNDLLGGLSGLDLTDVSALSKIDAVIQDVTAKQTELGAIQNRLESVLDSISVQYENLVSARSTVRDADVAKESAAYIKSQILQNASATLLATANQSPSLALTLINGLHRA